MWWANSTQALNSILHANKRRVYCDKETNENRKNRGTLSTRQAQGWMERKLQDPQLRTD